ncbi:MAG: hypothetical protein AABY22_10455 [Nanoarchaeota archaeon]
MENYLAKNCIICHNQIAPSSVICAICRQPCSIGNMPEEVRQKPVIFDAKSNCCDGDIDFATIKNTCSDECHEALVKKMEHDFGKFKRVVDAESGLVHKIPVRTIIENGIKQTNLKNFPLWDDGIEIK